MKRRSQKQIDARQDQVNRRQDLHNIYQNVVLTVYAVMLIAIFVVAFVGGILK